MQHNGFRCARASSAALIWNGRNGPTRSSPSFSWPIDVQVSVTSTSAPSAAARRVRGQGHRGAGVGGAFLGGRDELRVGLETGGGGDGDVHAGGDPAEHQRVRHVVGAVAEVGHPQPVHVPLRSARVCRSASTWHGWNSSDSALTTGTVDPDAIAVSRSCANVRQTIAST